MNTDKKIDVSVLMLTYNHAQYIEHAIKSVLEQNTNYNIELIICDDASLDNTQDIARSYAKIDSRIILSFQSKNTKFGKNFADGCSLIRGKYVAFCEGDDYWTSHDKLEKQVSFLENNPDFSVCAHKVHMLVMDDKQPDKYAQFIFKDCTSDEQRIKDGIFYADEAIANYYFQTGSLVLRWRFKDGLPNWFRKRMMFDHFMFMLHAVEGKIKYFDEVMSVWRRHGGGYTWLQTQDKGLFFQKEGEDWISMYKRMDEFFSKRFTWQIRERIFLALRSITSNCIETGNIDHINRLIKEYEEYFELAMKDAVLIDALRLVRPSNVEFSPPWENICLNKDKENILNCNFNINYNNFNLSELDQKVVIGGFHELSLEDIPEIKDSVWSFWTSNQEYARFYNLRSALMRYLWQNGVSTIWMPAYMPPILEGNRVKCQFSRKFYSISKKLDASYDFLSDVRSGEAVLTINYLGKPVPENLHNALRDRKDILWIEDRAQCLTPFDTFADAVIYSPRKLFGVPDGGLLIAKGAYELESWCLPTSSSSTERLSLLLERFENTEKDNTIQNMRYIKHDLEHQLSRYRMSKTTESILRRISFQEIADKRKANWNILYQNLGDYCLWEISNPDFAPFAFPFIVPDFLQTEIVHTLMSRAGIVCQRMWYPLVHEKDTHPIEEGLSKKLLLLPCDQRYNKKDMHHLSNVILTILQKRAGLDTISGEFGVAGS